MQYDLLIKNGYVVDYASAREGYFDVAVQNGMIAAVESSIGGNAVRELDASYKQIAEISRAMMMEASLIIMDEPTTGLHFADVHKLIEILRKLSEGGNTVVVIEHNLDVIKTADYIIDIGPEGGDKGGTVIAQGTPEEVAANPVSYTGQYVKKYLE